MVKIYTKTGDDGLTGLLGPNRVSKDDPRIEAYGTVDELNATLGVVRTQPGLTREIDEALNQIQEDLFVVGAALADPDPNGRFHNAFKPTATEHLERLIDRLEESLHPLTNFILPGGTINAARLHLARTVCRRAERQVVALARQPGQDVPHGLIVYLNRLGDGLFVLARFANAQAGVPDIPWSGL